MQQPSTAATSDETDSALAARLRRIGFVALVAAAIWLVVSIACTHWLSDRIIAGYLVEAARSAEQDAKAISGVVDRAFHELEAIPQVVSRSREIRAVVKRYNARGQAFVDLPREERSAVLKSDPDVTRLNAELTGVRNQLKYDLLYVLSASGIRIMTSDWDRPINLLGVQLDDREYFKEAMSAGMGHMFAVGRTTKNPVFFFSSPVQEDGQTLGVVVVRQDTEAVGALLGGRVAALIVDAAGMIMATSRPELALHHIGSLADRRPDDTTLRNIYAQEKLRSLDVAPSGRRLHEGEWLIDGQPNLVTRTDLKIPEYKLLVLTPLDWIAAVRPLHYVIGTLAALFGLLAILFVQRGASGLARRDHYARVTTALNEKLTTANADKDRYLGIAAHDLRNPLSSIRGLSELMMQMPLEPPQQQEFLETINRTSDEMLGLVNDLLDTSVIESGKLDLRRSDQDVAKLVKQRIRHLEAHARGKKIEVALDAPDGVHASIDAARFSQVIDNLVSNAIKFSPQETRVSVALRPDGDRLTFSVQDQGPGIPEADRKLLFRSFQKLSARPTGGEKSTGLGLAIVKRIVDAHAGTIEVESGAAGGTCFIVTVPVAPAPQGTTG